MRRDMNNALSNQEALGDLDCLDFQRVDETKRSRVVSVLPDSG